MSLSLWLVMGLILTIMVLMGYYATTPWADDWIFIGRSETLADAIASTLKRLTSWSPRPGSEPTIFGSLYLARRFGLAADDLTIPLLVASYLQSVGLLLWPCLLRRFRSVGYPLLSLSLACVLMEVALLHHLQVGEVLFWAAGSAAYLPTLAAWISGLCCLYLWGLSRERLLFWVAVVQCFWGGLFWEVGISGSLLMPGVSLLLMPGVFGLFLTQAGRRKLAPLVLPLLASATALLLLLIPVVGKRYLHESSGSSLSTIGALLWAIPWPVSRLLSLLAHHFVLVVPLLLLLAALLVAQVQAPLVPVQRRALLACGLSALLESVVVRYCLVSSSGRQLVYAQRYELVALVLLLLGLAFLLAAVLPAGVLIGLRGRSDTLALVAVSLLVLALLASGAVPEIVGSAVQKAKGLKSSPLVLAPDARSAVYDLACDRHAYALDLQLGEWTRSNLAEKIRLAPTLEESYKYKIIKGIISGHRLERLSVVRDGSAPCG